MEHGPVELEKVVVFAFEAAVDAFDLHPRVLHLDVRLHIELSEVRLFAKGALVKT